MNQNKNRIVAASCISFMICMAVMPKVSVDAALRGIMLWLNVVFPSLFPFFVVSEVLGKTGFTRYLGKLLTPIMRPLFNVPGVGAFAFVVGVVSGYPVGAKITADMRESGLLTRVEAERLIAFTNNSGPLFIIGAVAVGMLKMPELGLMLLGCHIASCVTVGILFRFYKKNDYSTEKKCSPAKSEDVNFGEVLSNAVKSGVMTMLAICGFITLFSVLISFLMATGVIPFVAGLLSFLGMDPRAITAVFSGAFEITTGINILCAALNISLTQKLVLCSLVIGWAGFSVHSQVLGIISNTDISLKPYILGKFIQSIIAAVYTFIYIKITPSSMPVFNSWNERLAISMNWYDYLMFSSTICGFLLLIIYVTTLTPDD